MVPEPIQENKYDDLCVSVYATNQEMGMAAARMVADAIVRAIGQKDSANIILATGNSQLTFLGALRTMPGIDWSKVDVFHMDEYVGIDPEHPASFPRFLRQHLLDEVKPRAFYPVPGQAKDLPAACREYEQLLRAHPADLVAMGIGENGHIAFNDPPFADFHDPVWAKVVTLDERSRLQQVGEGHFGSLDEVPTQAITLTIPALLSPKQALVIVPEARKAEAVARALTGPITTACPASILRTASHARLLLDRDAASQLPQ